MKWTGWSAPIGDPPLYLLDDEEEEVAVREEFLQTRNQIWGLLLACGPDQEIKKLAEEGMNLEIPIELKRIEDERFRNLCGRKHTREFCAV